MKTMKTLESHRIAPEETALDSKRNAWIAGAIGVVIIGVVCACAYFIVNFLHQNLTS